MHDHFHTGFALSYRHQPLFYCYAYLTCYTYACTCTCTCKVGTRISHFIYCAHLGARTCTCYNTGPFLTATSFLDSKPIATPCNKHSFVEPLLCTVKNCNYMYRYILCSNKPAALPFWRLKQSVFSATWNTFLRDVPEGSPRTGRFFRT